MVIFHSYVSLPEGIHSGWDEPNELMILMAQNQTLVQRCAAWSRFLRQAAASRLVKCAAKDLQLQETHPNHSQSKDSKLLGKWQWLAVLRTRNLQSKIQECGCINQAVYREIFEIWDTYCSQLGHDIYGGTENKRWTTKNGMNVSRVHSPIPLMQCWGRKPRFTIVGSARNTATIMFFLIVCVSKESV